MKREDVLWLLVKGLGLWALYQAAMQVPALVLAMMQDDPETTNTEQLLHVVVRLAVGLLLLADGPRLLGLLERRSTKTVDMDLPDPRPLSPVLCREDLLWVAMKVTGIALTMYFFWSTAYVFDAIVTQDAPPYPGFWFLVSTVVVVIVGLMLVFGSTLHRLAARR